MTVLAKKEKKNGKNRKKKIKCIKKNKDKQSNSIKYFNRVGTSSMSTTLSEEK